MFIHREGKATIIVAIIVSILIGWLFCQFLPNWMWFGYAMIAFLMVTVLQFFRNRHDLFHPGILILSLLLLMVKLL